MSRREFTNRQKIEIRQRATIDGVLYCEGCGVLVKGDRFEIDHIIAEALRSDADKAKKLTIVEGQLLCSGSPLACHDIKSRSQDVPAIARAVRREAAHLNIRRPKQSIPSAPGSLRGPARKHEGRPSLPPRGLYR